MQMDFIYCFRDSQSSMENVKAFQVWAFAHKRFMCMCELYVHELICILLFVLLIGKNM